MNQIAKLLNSDNVVADLQVSSKKRLFEQVGLLLDECEGLGRSQVFDALFSREKLNFQ